jgi:Recombinase/Integrase core domain
MWPRIDDACQALRIRHTRTKPRHAWTNGFVERLQGTILHEHWRIEFRRQYFTSRATMQRTLDGFLKFYNEQRPHQGYRLELEREKARQRTCDAMARKARALHVTGGKVYGYDNIEVHSSETGTDGGPRRLHVIRQVNREQAEVVRRIFTLSAGGMRITRIAKTLNADQVAPPRRARGWAPTAIREIVYRPLYRGEVVWNRMKKRDQWGVKKYAKRSESEWMHQEAPELRIVTDEVWRQAHERLERARTVYVRALEKELAQAEEQIATS